jgi:hypothetical protein
MSLGAAALVFGYPADAEARPGGGTRSMALGAVQGCRQGGYEQTDHHEAALGSRKSGACEKLGIPAPRCGGTVTT